MVYAKNSTFVHNNSTQRMARQNRKTHNSDDASDAPRYSQKRVLGSFVTCILAMATSGSGSFTPSVLIGTTWNVTAPVTLLVFFIASIVTAVEISKVYWNKIVREVDNVVLKVSSSQALTRIKSSVSASSLIANFSRGSPVHSDTPSVEQRSLVIAAKDPFLSADDVAELSLTDLRDLVTYASDVNRLDFNKDDFYTGISENARKAAVALSKAMVESRGKNVVMSAQPIGGEASLVENMDMLALIALTRLFAEWRMLRLVPNGYKRYAMGMGFAKRDLLQNIQKVETSVHSFLAHKETSGSAAVDYANGRQLSSPTIKQLLLWEKDQKIHARLPVLTDKSGASGLLWIQRQLQYQASSFQNLVLVPLAFPTAKDAVAAAYASTYEPYHGFIVKQMFQRSFDAAPDVSLILKQMDVQQARSPEDNTDEHTILTSIDEGCSVSVETNSSASRESIPDVIVLENDPIRLLVNHIATEWMKVEQFLNQCQGNDASPDASRNAVTVPAKVVPTEKVSHSQKAAKEEIPSFIAIFQPLLDGMDTLIDGLNMKDPTRC